MRKSTTKVKIQRVQGRHVTSARDVVTTEEPLEIRVVAREKGDKRKAHSVAVTMRTPGNDKELAVGFLYGEGILHSLDEVESVSKETASDVEIPILRIKDELSPDEIGNIVNVYLKKDVAFGPQLLNRNFYMTSSCGVCGKASLNALRIQGCKPFASKTPVVDAKVIRGLSASLTKKQSVFHKTGSLHAAALFDSKGKLVSVREDVGRHNAMDKLVGHYFMKKRLPLNESIALFSGRASWELMQKALVAGIPIVVAVGAPSSLAIDLAKDFNVTLVGFSRGAGFNVYAGTERIRTAE